MIQRIVAFRWSEQKQDHVEIPLDDAEAWVIELVRRFVGSSITGEQLADLLDREGWDRGVDTLEKMY